MKRTPPLHPGQEAVPGYRLQQLLGRGGFGEVWQADAGGATVALKFMPFANSLAAAKEIRAIQHLRQLGCPGLIHVERVWSVPGHVIICMELAEGSLQDLFQTYQSELGTPIPVDQVIDYLGQAGQTLDFLNARQHMIDGQKLGIQHADVKPSNMLLIGDTVKLADFGLATPTAAQNRAHRRQGTPDYAAPEVFAGQLSHQTDQYALAISYCFLRAGQLPYPAMTSMRRSWPGRRPDPDLSMLTPGEQPIIARALRRVPTERWPTCGEMMAQLAKAMHMTTPAVNNGAPAVIEERRQAPRMSFKEGTPCTVTEGGASVSMMARDISRHGIGLTSDRPVENGIGLLIQVPGPLDPPRALCGRVRHSTAQEGRGWFVGCMLVEKLSEADVAALVD
jgi:serine/threonine protein kinase